MHTMRRGYCSKLSGQIENLDHNKRAILRYEKKESMTFNPTRPDLQKFLKNLDVYVQNEKDLTSRPVTWRRGLTDAKFTADGHKCHLGGKHSPLLLEESSMR
jgi:hypothetical protein